MAKDYQILNTQITLEDGLEMTDTLNNLVTEYLTQKLKKPIAYFPVGEKGKAGIRFAYPNEVEHFKNAGRILYTDDSPAAPICIFGEGPLILSDVDKDIIYDFRHESLYVFEDENGIQIDDT